MNYYPFHIGDYVSATAHLEPLEDLAYRRMLDQYYLRESALPKDPAEVARLIRMRSNVAEVEAVLREFFEETEAGWVSERCDGEILKFQDKSTKAKASARASVESRKSSVEQTLNERSADVELTKTITRTKTNTPSDEGVARKRAARTPTRPDDVPENVWQDFQAIRKAKRAPLNDTALDGLRREAAKAGLGLGEAMAYCCEAGWQGFNAGWYADRAGKRAAAPAAPKSFAQQEREAGWARWEEMTGRVHPDRQAANLPSSVVIDVQDAPAQQRLERSMP